MSTLTESSRLESLADRVQEYQIGGCRLLILPTPVPSVVTWRGSFMSYPDFGVDHDLVQSLTVSLLDKGTRLRDRFALAELLEDRGAQVEFSSDGLYVDLAGRALTEDVPDVLALVAEQLRSPLFDPAEFEKARARMGAHLQRSLENTGAQATGGLTRSIYPKNHPNHTPATADRLYRLQSIELDDIRAYHDEHFGSNRFVLAVVGDVDEEALIRTVKSHFEDWPPHGSKANFTADGLISEPQSCIVSIPDKQNVDVRFGHPIGLRRNGPDFIPAYLANYVLGGNFSARLMQTIRDEMGLTYGIRSGLYGVTSEYAGHWHIAVTLSQENIERGIEETTIQIRQFVEGGVTADELQDKQTTIVGSFKVGLGTTSGLAASLLKNAERGFDVEYLDRFPDEVEAVTLERANRVVREYFRPDRLHTAIAGTIPEDYALRD